MDKKDNHNLIRKNILEWYEKNKNDYPWRTSKSLYQILITEILLQKTIASNVSNIFNDFFGKYEGFSEIFNAEIEELKSDIKTLGLSNKRAKILKDLSEMILMEYNGNIPEDPEILKKISGIADYVSNAYLCFGLNKRTFFFDVNITRFISRVLESSNSKVEIDIIKENLSKLVPKNECKHIYWAIIDFCNKICTKNRPKCDECPISKNCLYLLSIS
ncbi:MAG: endonuclease III domain-containing protein [Promethearchaeota archaeon]|jgi:A/G-specific adenine glycosylase